MSAKSSPLVNAQMCKLKYVNYAYIFTQNTTLIISTLLLYNSLDIESFTKADVLDTALLHYYQIISLSKFHVPHPTPKVFKWLFFFLLCIA